MKVTNFSRASVTYIAKINAYGKRLGATEIIIHSDMSVTMSCPDGGICERYKPSTKELERRV